VREGLGTVLSYTSGASTGLRKKAHARCSGAICLRISR
jgi:hypothetical protein